MPDYPIPRPNEPLADRDGLPSRAWYNFWRVRLSELSGEELQAQIEEIARKLGSPDGSVENIPDFNLDDFLTNATNVFGQGSVQTVGTLADGTVWVSLVGDQDFPFASYFYGTAPDGSKGWQVFTPDIIPSPHALYPVDENGNYLIDPDGNIIVADPLVQSNQVRVDRLPGATYSTLQEYVSLMTSPGLVTGGAIQNLGSGNIRITAGTTMIRDSDAETAPLYFADFPQTDFVVPADQDTRYFGLVYTAPGSVVVEMRTVFDWDKDSEIPLGSVVRFNGTTVVTDNPYLMADPITNIIQRFDAIGPAQRDNSVGGLIISETGTRNVTVTAGRIWARLSDFLTTAKNSSVDAMASVYFNGTNLTFTTGLTQWDNANYNNLGTGTLTPLVANRYANLWMFMSIDGSQYGFAYGTDQYTTLAAAAEEGVPPYLNQDFFGQALLLGRFIFKNGDPTASVIESAFTRAFTTSPVTNHNDLAGLQGGTTAQYYHLTQAQHENVAVIREALTGTRNYYVATTGSDSNNGLTVGTPFLTLQKAADTILALDTKGFQVIINVADGTYTAGMSVTDRTTGGSSIQVIGNTATPANVVIAAASGNCINANFGALCQISGMTLRAPAGSAVAAANGATIFVLGGVVFDDVTNDHILADSTARVYVVANYTVIGDCTNHWHATNTGSVFASGLTITVTGTPTMVRWAGAAGGSVIGASSNTYVGSMTGDKFLVHRVALINTEGAGVSAFPGSVAGTQIAATGGYYV